MAGCCRNNQYGNAVPTKGWQSTLPATELMSVASNKGRSFETDVAKQLRRKGIKAYRDKRSGAGDIYKADISAPGFSFHLELKAQKTIKLLDWWRQAKSGCPIYKTPALMIESDGGDRLTVLATEDFMNMVKTIKDDAETITKLR